ncbi:hypothetical protein E3N88_19936 [Mikania micrantha]|uniref:Uncharacterized protein n=1 Tax=Mikania micrantha TaxID=192012 RepID=A0A5N6NR88_9ASTR|nr:hypothetical protein E3N88_19936 [Mikania micrantha]
MAQGRVDPLYMKDLMKLQKHDNDASASDDEPILYAEASEQGGLELLEQIKKSPKHGLVEQKSSLVFIPRKKRGDAGSGCNSQEQLKQPSTQACSTTGIAAVADDMFLLKKLGIISQ